MISHAECAHASTPSDRAKCRRARGRGEVQVGFSAPLFSLGPPPKVKEATWGGKAHHDPDRERNTGQVPGRRDLECHVCHVERIAFAGTDPQTRILLFVGERCSWRVERSEDFRAVKP